MDPAVCFAYIAVGSLLFLFSRIVYCYYRLRHIPGPFWAAWTNIPRAFWVQSGHAHLIHKRLHEQYGPLVRVGPEAVSVDAPEAIPIIYPTKPGFVKGGFYETLKPYSGKRGAIPAVFPTQDEELHRRLKKPVAPLYSKTSAAALEPLVDQVLLVFLRELDQRFLHKESEFDLGFWLKAFAFDTMGTLTFSRRYGFLETGGDVDGMEASIWKFMVKAAPMTQIPWLDKVLYKNRLAAWISPPTSSPILNFVAQRIAEREAGMTSGLDGKTQAETQRIHSKDMLSHFLKVPDMQPSVPHWAPVSWTFSNILAGSDSAATVLGAIWYNLLSNTSSLCRLQEEISSVHKVSLPFPTWSDIQDLPYLDACIWEGIRLHPPFALPLERVVPRGGIQICDQHIPSNVAIGMSAYVANRNKSIFGEQEDLWIPERWLSADPEHKKRLQSHIMTFGSGRRVCMGQNVAFVEMKKATAALMANYHLKLGESTSWSVENRWFLRNDGLFARITRRNS